MILSTRCAGCRTRGPVLCRTCRFALISRPTVEGPAGVVIASAYTGRVRDVLLGFKYNNRRAVAGHIGAILVRRLMSDSAVVDDLDHVDVVTWAPTSGARRRQRGFDQAELIARSVAAQLGLPCRPLLERDQASGPQTGRHRHDRVDPELAPRFRVSPRALGKRVLLVDDVVTTGATLAGAAAALRSGGAYVLVEAAVAATPATVRALEHAA